MLELVLKQKNVNFKTRVGIKTVVSLLVIILAIVLPQIVHIFAGATGGVLFLPMYLPILLGGCLLGAYWGVGIGIIAPILSFLFTSLLGNPMPIAIRLPYMVFELGIFGLVSGLFSKLIFRNKWFVYPAIICAIIFGRLAFLGLAFIFQNISTIQGTMAWNQILSGYAGVIIQIVVLPLIIFALLKLLKKD